MIGGPIIDFINLFGLGWLGGTIGIEGITRFFIWIIFFALFQGILSSNVSPSFISGKKRIASVLSLALSLLVALGIPNPVIRSMLAGFGIIGATSFIVVILAAYGAVIKKIGEGEEEQLSHCVAKFFITVVIISILSAFQAATAGASGGMPAGVITSYNQILEWAILIPTIYLFYILYKMFTFGSDSPSEQPAETQSAAQRRRESRFRLVESRLLRARELLEDAERSAANWDTDSRAQTEQQLRQAQREIHTAWTQLRRARRADRDSAPLADNIAARMQAYENMINDLIRINATRPTP